MADSYRFLFLVLLVSALIISSSTVDASEDHSLNWVPTRTRGCRGTVAECMGNDEFEMDSEISRRILATSNYISYAALEKNSIPCSQRGASYYNCQEGAEANPYSRGCSAITRCRS
ncbi:hypothetical protein OIU84_016486 [Salix udensis]|uniref:Rapid alkalinization factor 1 n=1 Tax=Salix udensis TaxID=889485 RepID=A0AAD6NQ85_9ROSI|nr:hypothetical protein OIU84_016486 [Salix udensis]